MAKKIQLKIYPAIKDDCDDVFAWANDPETRSASFRGSKISYSQHCSWFKASLRSKERRLFIGKDHSGKKVGIVRLDRMNKESLEVSVNIAPQMRGKGYGRQLIEAVCRKKAFPGTRLFIARIKRGNPASIKAFETAGFRPLLDYKRNRENVVVMMRLAL